MILIFTVLLFSIDGVIGEYCFKSFMVTQYCTFGCCGEDFYKYCCPSTGPIIGIVIGLSVFFLIIIVCCCLCKKQATRGTVLQRQQPVAYNTNTGPQQPATYTHQQSGAATYVYPTANVGYTAATTNPGPPIPGAVGGYPYQQQPMTHAPPAPPPGSYPPPPVSYPQHQPTSSYQHPQQMPSYNYDTQYTQKQPTVEPSAPPPSYEEAQKYAK